MPFSFKPTRPTFSTISHHSNANPWSTAPLSPTEELRRSFKAFTHAENLRRAERNEMPFCSPQGRDRAFEKLLRLSRGEEVLSWKIDVASNDWEDRAIEEWCMEFFGEGRDGIGNGGSEEKEGNGEVEGGVELGMGPERKDSKEVVDKGGDGWRSGRLGDTNGNEDENETTQEMAIEYMEDIGKE
jgi:hypothetical protein